jgi:exosortase A
MATLVDRNGVREPGRGGSGVLVRYAPLLATSIAIAGVLLVYRDTAESIVAIWIRSETFAHGFVVIPICLWLGWRKRAELASATAAPWWPGLVAVSLAGALWLVTSLADVLGVKQFALAFMLQAAVVSVLGLRVARVLVLPLGFLLFAVPAGEFLVPVMIDRTADFTVAALRLSGVPVYREGNLFTIPSGSWSVVEACSGVRYLIASVMVGVLYAALAYRSWTRRIVFIAASIVVPVIANWFRAYMIVMIGHLSDNRLAVGVDHIIYGWVFFGLVMLLLFWAGSLWAQADVATPEGAAGGTARTNAGPRPGATPSRFYAAALAAIAVAALWRPVEALFDRVPVSPVPALAALPAERGWSPLAQAPFDWQPDYSGFAAASQEGFSRDGTAAGIFIALYRGEGKGHELITSRNALVLPSNAQWHQLSHADAEVDWLGRKVAAVRSEIAGRGGRLIALRLYWIDGTLTSSDYVAKALLAWSKLSGRGGDSAVVVSYAPPAAGRDPARELLEAMAPHIEYALHLAQTGKR